MNVLIEFDRPAEPLNLNQIPATRYAAKQWRAAKNSWKDATAWAGMKAFSDLGLLGPKARAMPPCHFYMSIPVWGNRRRDAHNWHPTAKPCVDALVELGVWPDDTDEWVLVHTPDLRPVSRETLATEKVYIRLVPREAAP